MKTKEPRLSNSTSLASRIWKGRTAYLLLAPLLIGLLVFCYYPPVSGLYHAFFDWNVTGEAIFVGLNNFKELFSDPVFLNSVPTLLMMGIPMLLISVVMPLIMAELIYAVRHSKLKYLYRVLVLLPMVAPGLIYTLIWEKIYDPQIGLLTSILRLVGVVGEDQVINWLGDPDLVIWSLIFKGFPWIGGTSVLIYMAGLMEIPSDVVEAAVLDGCTTIKRIWYVDLPQLMGQVKYFLVFGLIGVIQDYNNQLLITEGGPGYTTYVPGYYMYVKAFTAGRMGYACAVGFVMFIVIFLLTIFIMKPRRHADD